MTVAVLFPGQGSQYPGMADPWTSHHAGRALLQDASDALGYDVVEACREEARLSDTAALQPILFACELAAFRVLEAEGVEVDMAAGHSLGEFAALVAAGAVPFRRALEVVVERGRATGEAAQEVRGAMSAIVGPSPDEVQELCRIAGRGDVLAVAAENAPRQAVVSGTVAAVERAEALARSRGARVVRLDVAGAFHSPLMRPALPPLRQALAWLPFYFPRFPVVPNASGRPLTHPEALRDVLSRHLVSTVRWERSMRAMAAAGITLFVEAGPGEVLARLARRCVPGARAVSVGSPAEVSALASSMKVSRP